MANEKQSKNFILKTLPKTGETIKGKILEMKKNEIYVDIDGYFSGIIRGPEIIDQSGEYSNLKIGDEITATVLDQDNEKGLVELSLKIAGQKKVWNEIEEIFKKKETMEVSVLKANKGGLIVAYHDIVGFLPTSQLASSHYPKVKDGDKNKILEKLQKLIGKKLKVKIANLEPESETIIFSEKKVNQNSQQKKTETKEKLIGQIVEAKVVGLADFGAFVSFDNQEGLIHISELSWERVEKIEDVVKVGDTFKAKVIGLSDNGKFSLSLKQLKPNPWEEINKIYKVGDVVEATVTKITPFGIFAKLKEGVQGLAHISELSDKQVNLENIAKIGQKLKFKIISLEPENQRLGLSLKL